MALYTGVGEKNVIKHFYGVSMIWKENLYFLGEKKPNNKHEHVSLFEVHVTKIICTEI